MGVCVRVGVLKWIACGKVLIGSCLCLLQQAGILGNFARPQLEQVQKPKPSDSRKNSCLKTRLGFGWVYFLKTHTHTHKIERDKTRLSLGYLCATTGLKKSTGGPKRFPVMAGKGQENFHNFTSLTSASGRQVSCKVEFSSTLETTVRSPPTLLHSDIPSQKKTPTSSSSFSCSWASWQAPF